SPRLAERTNRGKKVIRPIRRQRKIGSPAVGNEHYPGSGYHRAGNGQRRTMMSTLVLDGVSKIYGRGDTAVTALAEASLRVEAGELVALVGPSGSGAPARRHCRRSPARSWGQPVAGCGSTGRISAPLRPPRVCGSGSTT